MKFHDVGESSKEYDMDSPSTRTKKEKYYPSLQLTPEQLPEIKNWKVGKDYTVMTKLRQTSYEKRDRLGRPSKEEFGFDIRQVAVNFKNAIMRKEHDRRFNNPRTDAERTKRHKARFGTDKLPVRGTGLNK